MSNPVSARRTGRGLAAAAILLSAACMTPDVQHPGTGLLGPGRAVERADEFGSQDDRAPSAKSLHASARICASQGRDADCEIILNRIMLEHPDYMPAYSDLAELYVRNRMVDSAIQTLRIGLRREPDDVVLLNNLGMCFMLLRRYDSAVGWFTEASGVEPVNARTRANMAAGLGLMGRIDESFSLFLQVMPARDAHHNVGVLCEAVGRHDEAARHFALARG